MPARAAARTSGSAASPSPMTSSASARRICGLERRAERPGGHGQAVADAGGGIDGDQRQIKDERRVLEAVVHDDDVDVLLDEAASAGGAVAGDHGGRDGGEQQRLVADFDGGVDGGIDQDRRPGHAAAVAGGEQAGLAARGPAPCGRARSPSGSCRRRRRRNCRRRPRRRGRGRSAASPCATPRRGPTPRRPGGARWRRRWPRAPPELGGAYASWRIVLAGEIGAKGEHGGIKRAGKRRQSGGRGGARDQRRLSDRRGGGRRRRRGRDESRIGSAGAAASSR